MVDRKLVETPQYFYCWRPEAALLFWFFGEVMILDVARCYLWLFSLYINIKIDKK